MDEKEKQGIRDEGTGNVPAETPAPPVDPDGPILPVEEAETTTVVVTEETPPGALGIPLEVIPPEKPPEPAAPVPEKTKIPEPAGRNYMAEAEILMKAHPELGHTSVPDEVFKNCIEQDMPMLQAYDAYLIHSLQGDVEKLKAENAALRHNAETQLRAPVTGGGPGIASGAEHEDNFLKGFNRI